MHRILITGSNRGLGFEFTRQYAAKGSRVFATCRRPDDAAGLNRLAAAHREQISVHQLDVADSASIRGCFREISSETDQLDVLINNAGVYSAAGSASPAESLGNLTFEDALDVLRVNSVAPILVAQQFVHLLRASGQAKIVNITSGYGSISENTSGFPYYYSAAKAALNQMTRSLAHDVQKLRITAVVMDPGWVATDMGGESAPVSPEEAVRAMIQVVDSLTPRQNGQNLDRFGEKRPW